MTVFTGVYLGSEASRSVSSFLDWAEKHSQVFVLFSFSVPGYMLTHPVLPTIRAEYSWVNPYHCCSERGRLFQVVVCLTVSPVPAPKDRHLFDLSASGFSLLNPTTKSLVALGRTGHLLFLKHILWSLFFTFG